MRHRIVGKGRGRALAALLALMAVSASAQDAFEGDMVIGTIEAGGSSASGMQRLQLKGKDYLLKSPRIAYANGAAAAADALRPGTRVRLHLRRSGEQAVVERIEILPD